MTVGSLLSRGSPLAETSNQRKLLESDSRRKPFDQALKEAGLYPLRATGIEVLQVNLGKLCNQACRHCHVDAGPDRREVMDRRTVRRCLGALAGSDIPVLDLTGGAPEMNPHFRWLVEEARRLGRRVIDRCNLTILSAPGFQDLPEFLARHQVEIVASLPCYLKENVNAQPGNGAFDDSIEALGRLNAAGYGLAGPRAADERRRRGRIELADASAVTSACRWQALGPWRTTWINQVVVLGYHLGVSPERLARWYRGAGHCP